MIKKYNLDNEKVQFLIKSDKKLALVIKYIKKCNILLEKDDFKCLVKYIIGQQISDKTREVIWQKLCTKYNDISPKTMSIVDDQELRNLGICRQKINYIKNLSFAILNNEINFKEFKNLSNQEIINKLTKIKGIGNWTAEMYLIFSLGRENVLSRGDNTLKRVLKWLYGLEKLPSNNDVEKYFKKWEEYSTIVSAYFWEAIAMNLLVKDIDDLKKGD